MFLMSLSIFVLFLFTIIIAIIRCHQKMKGSYPGIEQIRGLRPRAGQGPGLSEEAAAACRALKSLQMAAKQKPGPLTQKRTPTRFRRRKRGQAGTRRHRHHRLSISWWNIEGVRRALALSPSPDPLANADVCLLGETFATATTSLPKYKTHEQFAESRAIGRPVGGLLAGFQGKAKFELRSKGPRHMHCRLMGIDIFCFYFQPETPIEDVINETAEALSKRGEGPVIVAGDFNCRLDNDSDRGPLLTSALAATGLTLANQADQPTYVCSNGTSTIDLFFTNVPSAVSGLSVEDMIIRKHRRLLLALNIWMPTDHRGPRARPRKIDTSVLARDSRLALASHSIEAGLLENAVQTLTEAIAEASVVPRRALRHHKDWFDRDCRAAKARVLAQLPGTPAYAAARRLFVHLIDTKRKEHRESLLIAKVHAAESRPWMLLPRSGPLTTNASLGPQDLRAHFERLFLQPQTSVKLPLVVPEAWHDRPFTQDEVEDVILRSRNNKAPGRDSLTNEQLKGSLQALAGHWTKLFNTCLERGEVPSSWKSSDMFLLFKGKGQPDDLDNYRGIALQSNPFKALTKLVKERLEQELDNRLSDAQHGFRKGRSTLGPLQEVIDEVALRLEKPRQFAYGAFIDFKKAFDSVDRGLLMEALRNRFNVGGRIGRLIRALLAENTINVRSGPTASGPISQTVGVVQGDSLSPYLFILFIDDIADALDDGESTVRLYADDLLLTANTAVALQRALDKLCKWALDKKLTVNVKKSAVMKFRRGGPLASHDFFTFGSERLDIAKEYCYLGVTLQPTLCFSNHVKRVKAKALAASYSCMNLQALSIHAGLSLFSIRVLPVLSYGLQCIAPRLSLTHLVELDVVQSLYLKRLLGLPKHSSATLAHELTGRPFLMEGLLADGLSVREAVALEYSAHVDERRTSFAEANYTEGPAFMSEEWKGPLQSNRHWVTSFTAHGFHQLWCSDTEFHEAGPDCLCAYCNTPTADRYHLLSCSFIPSNLSLNSIFALLS